MDQKEYSVPHLLQDIRELLLGIALILFAIHHQKSYCI